MDLGAAFECMALIHPHNMKELVLGLSLISGLILLVSAVNVDQVKPRGPLMWSDDFDYFDTNRWKHLITGWRGGNMEFQYYDNRPENR